MEKSAKVGDEVLILSVPWHEDIKYIGQVRKLKGMESNCEYAYTYGDSRSHIIVIKNYILATELLKALS
jgi:hypothetical protein